MKIRYHALDTLRGFTLLNMIVYHLIWDLVYLYDMPWSWFQGTGAYIWQQSICWTFILLSGFCWQLGSKPLQRGATVFVAGLLVTAVTVVAMPEERIIFGILTLLGSCMLLMAFLHKYCQKVKAKFGFVLSVAAFVVLRKINQGFLGFADWNLWELPRVLYQNLGTAYLGFPPAGFFSTDYFSLLPWCFLFMAGYYLYNLFQQHNFLQYLQLNISWLAVLGKKSLLIYLFHQPVIYLILKFLPLS